jgi:O-antigen/teichoic acid export membrane protein
LNNKLNFQEIPKTIYSTFFGGEFLSTKISTDISWNMISNAIVGIIGLLLNIIIARYYGSGVLGVFNQIYAIFIILSQLAVSGVHLSILKVSAQFSNEPQIIRSSFTAGLLITTITAIIVSILAFAFKDIFSFALSSPEITNGLVLTLPGLFFFSLNKSLLALLNGLRLMKPFAVFQMLRFLLMLASLLGLIILRLEGIYIPIIFTLSETILFLIQLPFVFRWIDPKISENTVAWMKNHFSFGIRAMLGNLLLDANSRADVLILGIFTSDSVVGIYSFAAMLAEGFLQITVVLRTIINPLLTKTFHDNGELALEKIVNRGKRLSYFLIIPLGVGAILIYPLLRDFVHFGFDFNNSWFVFAILISGIMLAGGYQPFQMIFNQVGQPSHQTLFILTFFLTNVLLNLLFIPFWGMFGSAFAIAITYLLQIIYIKKFSTRWIGIRI